MTCLVLRLSGPMQSWGTQSRFTERDTGREPSKSGVIGLLCAAMGIDRNDDSALVKFCDLKMGVRIDRDGVVCKDFHTAGGGTWNGKDYGVIKASGGKGDTVISNRYYLADAEFHAALESENVSFLRELENALAHPVWPLFLGRKSFLPTPPICLGIVEGDCKSVLSAVPWRKRRRDRDRDAPKRLRIQLECSPDDGAARLDSPLSFAIENRRFGLRYVKSEFIEGFPIPEEMEAANAPVPFIA